MKLKDSTQPPDTSARTAWHEGKANPKRSRRGPIRLWKGRLKLPLPRRTVRLRLTLLYSSLFLALGAGLLALTYVLAARRITAPVSVSLGTPSRAGNTDSLAQLLHAQATADLHQFLIQSGVAFSII